MVYSELEKSYQHRTEKLLTREEAAHILGIQPSTLAKWVTQRKNGLAFVKIGSRVRYRQPDIEEFIRRNTSRELFEEWKDGVKT